MIPVGSRAGEASPGTAGADFAGVAAAMAAPAAAIALTASPASAAATTSTATTSTATTSTAAASASHRGQLVKAPYARTIEGLFDGRHRGDQVLGGLPGTVKELLTPFGMNVLRHPAGGLAAALRSTDSVCSDWTPRAPVRLYYATNDEQAVNANTVHCQAAFAARGLPVPTVNLGTPSYQGSRHLGANVAATAHIVRWFRLLASVPGQDGAQRV